MADTSRADLLQYLLSEKKAEQLAEVTGFEVNEPDVSKEVSEKPEEWFAEVKSFFEDFKSPVKESPRPAEHFWALAYCEPSKLTNRESIKRDPDIAEIDNVALLSEEDEDIRISEFRVPKQPLVQWNRLWPVLESVLRLDTTGKSPDTDKLVRLVSKGKWPHRIPVKHKKHGAPQSHILVDLPERLAPLHNDINSLLKRLGKTRGYLGLSIQQVEDYPGGSVFEREGGQEQKASDILSDDCKPWHPPEPNTPFLVISDLGIYDKSLRISDHWLKLGRQLRDVGCWPVALVPVPSEWLPTELTSLYQCISWDVTSHLQPIQGGLCFDQVRDQLKIARIPFLTEEEKTAAKHKVLPDKTTPGLCARLTREEYMIWLSAAVEMDSHTIRAIRLAQGKPLSVADEILLWNSGLTVNTSNLSYFHTEEQERLRDHLLDRISGDPEKALSVYQQLKETLKTQIAMDYFEALLFFKGCDRLSIDDRALVQQGEEYRNRFIKTMVDKSHSQQKGIHYYSGQIFDRQSKLFLDRSSNKKWASYWWAHWHNQQEKSSLQRWPDWSDKQTVSAVLNQPIEGNYNVEVAILGESLVIVVNNAKGKITSQLDNAWVPIIQEQASDSILPIQYKSKDSDSFTSIDLSKQKLTKIHLRPNAEIACGLTLNGQLFWIDYVKKPSWAASLYHQAGTVKADLILNGIAKTANSVLRESSDSNDLYGPAWHFKNSESDPYFIGRDQYGLYADLNFFGVTQRFRWIEPGTFLMGFSEGEIQRGGNEKQHQEVTLIQGYWLADTCTTQELWQAVMGNNPSYFQGEQNPVDSVSWWDCWQFNLKIKEKHPALRIRLPSEAQWEYACRAGTTTPFSFGDQIHSDQVNFNGDYPYAGGKNSDYREQTVPVKSLPANPWGLYEMHGNLDEWCQSKDLKDDDKSFTYPEERWFESSEKSRPLRGGGWDRNGRSCRSAHRLSFQADFCSHRIGFRLSIGPEQLGGVAEKGLPAREE